MEGGNGLRRQSSALWSSFRNGDFEEEDVWDVLKERTASDSLYGSSTSVSRHLFRPSAARMIPRPTHSHCSSGGSSYNSRATSETQNALQSTPLPIPQWLKIRGENSIKAPDLWNDDDDGDDHDAINDDDEDDDDGDDDEDEEYGNNKVPPHELIAKRLARTQISSFSVFEGVGRTLKGRDLSKVRNAVLTKTGFLESL